MPVFTVETEVVVTTTYHFEMETDDRVEIQHLISEVNGNPSQCSIHVSDEEITFVQDEDEVSNTGFENDQLVASTRQTVC